MYKLCRKRRCRCRYCWRMVLDLDLTTRHRRCRREHLCELQL